VIIPYPDPTVPPPHVGDTEADAIKPTPIVAAFVVEMLKLGVVEVVLVPVTGSESF
jgi:hypothetical protein